MLILRKKEEKNKTRKGRGKKKTLPLRAMRRPQRPGPSSLPAWLPVTLQPMPRTILPLTESSTLFSPQPTLKPGWETVGTCQFLFMSWLPPQRLPGPRPVLSLQDLSNLKMGSFFGLLSRQWGRLLNLLLSAWVLSKDFPGDYILREQCHLIWKDILPIHTKKI